MARKADNKFDEETTRVLESIEEEGDPRICCAELKRKIEQFQKAGERVPEALLVAQQQLIRELMAESQGR